MQLDYFNIFCIDCYESAAVWNGVLFYRIVGYVVYNTFSYNCIDLYYTPLIVWCFGYMIQILIDIIFNY